MFALFIDDRTEVDLQELVDYYDSLSNGLGKKFLVAFEKELALLSTNPFYRIRYRNIRCKSIKRFPYQIHYSLNLRKKQLFVYGIINSKRGPSKSKISSK